jgi:ABC-type multidrug transport system ATPase subunit
VQLISVHACRLLAIMGPSGGGKTSLLNALAGQVPATKGMRLRGDLAINGAPRAAASVRQAYVQQEDMFYAQLTVRRVHLAMSMALCCPSKPKQACSQVMCMRGW